MLSGSLWLWIAFNIFANTIEKFYYLELGLAVVLSFVGVKIVLTGIYDLSTAFSLVVIAVILTAAIIASTIRARRSGTKNTREERIKANQSAVGAINRHLSPIDEWYMLYSHKSEAHNPPIDWQRA